MASLNGLLDLASKNAKGGFAGLMEKKARKAVNPKALVGQNQNASGDHQKLLAQIMGGQLGLSEAELLSPGIMLALKDVIGNDALGELMGAGASASKVLRGRSMDPRVMDAGGRKSVEGRLTEDVIAFLIRLLGAKFQVGNEERGNEDNEADEQVTLDNEHVEPENDNETQDELENVLDDLENDTQENEGEEAPEEIVKDVKKTKEQVDNKDNEKLDPNHDDGAEDGPEDEEDGPGDEPEEKEGEEKEKDDPPPPEVIYDPPPQGPGPGDTTVLPPEVEPPSLEDDVDIGDDELVNQDPPQMELLDGDLESYAEQNPDTDVSERIDGHGYVTDSLARDTNKLAGKVELPPEKSWVDHIAPRQEWFAFNQKLAGNPWKGQDKALSFMHQLTSTLDLMTGVADKVGMAVDISGVVLTIFFPPVGAFLLSVGRIIRGISLALKGVSVVTRIVQSVMLAVKAAKEKDPIKRLEMMQEMRGAVQAGVTSGIDIVLSKVGKTGKKASSRKGLKEMKESFGKAVSKDGRNAALQRMKTVSGNAAQSMKALPGKIRHAVTNPRATMKALSGKAWEMGKERFRKSEMGAGWHNLKNNDKVWASWRQQLNKSGGYRKALKDWHLPNLTGRYKAGRELYDKAGDSWWKKSGANAKNLKTDLFDKKGGGLATHIDVLKHGEIKGGSRSYLQSKNDRRLHHVMTDMHAAQKADPVTRMQRFGQGVAVGGHGLEMARAGSEYYEDYQKMKERSPDGKEFGVMDYAMLHGADMASGAFGSVKGAHGAIKEPPHKTWWEIATGLVATGDAYNKDIKSKGEVQSDGTTKTALEGLQGGAKFEVIKHDADKLKKSDEARVQKMRRRMAKEQRENALRAKNAAASAQITALINKRHEENMNALKRSGEDAPGGGPLSMLPPAPDAPPEGYVIPDAALLINIAEQKASLASSRASLMTLVARAKEERAAALAGDAELLKIDGDLSKMGDRYDKEKVEGEQDKEEIEGSIGELKEGAEEIGDGTNTINEEKSNTDNVGNEGKNLNLNPDPNKVREEERKREAEEKKKQSWAQRAWNAVKAAASWVMKKIVGPAVAAVKGTVNKVMKLITDMFMGAILGILKLFLSEEESTRLSETMAEMKKEEAESALAATEKAQKQKDEHKADLTKAQEEVMKKVETCDENITEGEGLLAQVDQHEQTLDAEAEYVRMARDTYEAQYGPYFEWVALYKQAAELEASGDDGSGLDLEGPDPTRPLEPLVGQAIRNLGEVVQVESRDSQAHAKAEAADLLRIDREGVVSEDVKTALAEHDKAESKRQAEVGVLMAEAMLLSSMPLEEAMVKAQELQAEINTLGFGISESEKQLVEFINEAQETFTEGIKEKSKLIDKDVDLAKKGFAEGG